MTELHSLRNALVASGAAIIASTDKYLLTAQQNTWDTNYHLYAFETNNEYVIDSYDTNEAVSAHEMTQLHDEDVIDTLTALAHVIKPMQ